MGLLFSLSGSWNYRPASFSQAFGTVLHVAVAAVGHANFLLLDSLCFRNSNVRFVVKQKQTNKTTLVGCGGTRLYSHRLISINSRSALSTEFQDSQFSAGKNKTRTKTTSLCLTTSLVPHWRLNQVGKYQLCWLIVQLELVLGEGSLRGRGKICAQDLGQC